MGPMDERRQKHVLYNSSELQRTYGMSRIEIHMKDSRKRLVLMLHRFLNYKTTAAEGIDEMAAELEDMRGSIVDINLEVKPSDIMMALVKILITLLIFPLSPLPSLLPFLTPSFSLRNRTRKKICDGVIITLVSQKWWRVTDSA